MSIQFLVNASKQWGVSATIRVAKRNNINAHAVLTAIKLAS